jgi:hypothetical protein
MTITDLVISHFVIERQISWSETGFRHRDDILQVELGSRHVDLDLDFNVPPGVPKDVLMQKLDLQTQRANT